MRWYELVELIGWVVGVLCVVCRVPCIVCRVLRVVDD